MFGMKKFAVAATAALGALGTSAALAGPATAAPHGSTATVSAVAAHRTVWIGAKGAAVRLAQADLARRGYRLAVDGVFGPKARAAVRAFQAAQGITVDGVVGPVTWYRLAHPHRSAVPTLGLRDWGGAGLPSARGFGVVRPGEIFNGGDPTGLVVNITWRSWGGKTAIGTGTGYYVAPGQKVYQSKATRATVYAYDLTTCAGQPAYRKVTWWFPSKGGTLRNTLPSGSYDLCGGK